MLAAHAVPDPRELYTVSAGGFSATADAFARDPDSEGLWFLSMVGSQSAVKAIWAALLKQPPDAAHLLAGTDGMALSGGFHSCAIPHETVGTWTTKIARLPVSGGWHALVYTRMAEYAFEREGFLLLAPGEEEAPALHQRFLDRRSPLPLHRSWAEWLWRRGLARREIVPLQSAGIARLPLPTRRRSLAGRPLRGGGVGNADAAAGGARAAIDTESRGQGLEKGDTR